MRFNLVDDPWIAVRGDDGGVEEVSIRDAFHRAGELRGMAGELPTQDFAVLRILLAVLYRVELEEVCGDPLGRAKELWNAPALPLEAIDAYLDRWRERFELLDPVAPFMQASELASGNGETRGVELLIPDAPQGEPLFTMRAGVESLPVPEAARWLVHAMAYDYSGIKTGAVGDHRAKGGRGYPMGIGWAGWLGGIVVEGDSVRQTLLLNLVLTREADKRDKPIWELEPLTAAPRNPATSGPYGPAGLFTWPQRRIRLFRTEDRVTAALVCNGDPVEYHLQSGFEPMTAWRLSEAQGRKHTLDTVYMPRAHDPQRAFWRGLASHLPGIEPAAGKPAVGKSAAGKDSDVPKALPAEVLAWAGELISNQVLPRSFLIRARAIGFEYGPQMASFSNLAADELVFSPILAAHGSAAPRACVITALRRADEGVQALALLGGTLALAAGGERGPAAESARAHGYHVLDRAFRSWLASITPETNLAAAAERWATTARELLLAEGVELVASAGPGAWTGRVHEKNHISTGQADADFRSELYLALPIDDAEAD